MMGSGGGVGSGPGSAGNIQGSLHQGTYLGDGERKKKKRKAVIVERRTLYIQRPVKNADEIIAWAKSVGFKTTIQPDDMHVTVAYSKQPLLWSNVGVANHLLPNAAPPTSRGEIASAVSKYVTQAVHS